MDFNAVYNEHFAAVNRYVSRRIRNESDAADVVQEVFVGFWKNISKYDGRPLENLLVSIASHKVADFLRKSYRSHVATTGDESIEAIDSRDAVAVIIDHETKAHDDAFLAKATSEIFSDWLRRGLSEKVECVRKILDGMQNNVVAEMHGLTNAQVAMFKFEFIRRAKTIAAA